MVPLAGSFAMFIIRGANRIGRSDRRSPRHGVIRQKSYIGTRIPKQRIIYMPFLLSKSSTPPGLTIFRLIRRIERRIAVATASGASRMVVQSGRLG
jgi:hypothetical protein